MRKNRYDLDRRSAGESQAVQAVVAALFVLGLASLLFLHADGVPTSAAPLATSSNDSRRAPPTSDPSLPDVRTLVREKDEDDPQAPTF